MGGIGRNLRCRQNKRYRKPYFELRKEYFLLKSPFLNYETTREEYETFNSGNFSNLRTPITKSKYVMELQKHLKKKNRKVRIDHTPTFEKILNRSLEVSAPDILPSIKEDRNYNIVNLKINNVPERRVAETEFKGFRLANDKLASLTSKGHSTITLNQEFKTLDGYKIRLSMIAITKRRDFQTKKASYANKEQIKKIRTVMTEIISKHLNKMKILEFVEQMVVKCGMSEEIRIKCENIYPLDEKIFITKIKVL